MVYLIYKFNFVQIGSIVEVQLPDTSGWHEVVLLSAKDKSIYTVEFDDGDVRTLSRGSLCLQGKYIVS